MYATAIFVTLLICICLTPLQVSAQSTTPLRSRLEKAPTAVILYGAKMSITAELWYDQMPTVGNPSKKYLLGTLRLVGEGKRMPAIAIHQAWLLYQDRLWACKVKRHPAESSGTTAEFRLIDTPTVEQIPAGAEVTVVVRLQLKNNRTRLLKAPTQTIQNVY